MTSDQCTFTGCDRQLWANGLCNAHNNQRHRGEALRPLRQMSERRSALKQKVLDRVTPEPNTGCWLFHGFHDSHGYPRVWDGKARRMATASRVMVDAPDGKCANHKCHNPGCVNPDHIYTGTHAENTRDMIKAGRAKWQTK